MAVYGGGYGAGVNNTSTILESAEEQLVSEALIVDTLMHNFTESERKEYLESDEMGMLVEAGAFRKSTLIRLSKNDDLERRAMLACIQIGISKNDPTAKLLAKIRIQERKALDILKRKYWNEAMRQVKKDQRAWLKNAKTLKKKFINK